MHIDNFSKIRLIIDKRTQLIEARDKFREMFAEGVIRTGDPTPVTVSSEYSVQDAYQKTVRVWLDASTAEAILVTMDGKIGALDVVLGDLGIETYERED